MALAASASASAAARSIAWERFAEARADGSHALTVLVEGLRCGGCVSRIERDLASDPQVVSARVNLSTRRLALAWRGGAEEAARLLGRVEAAGFAVQPFQVQAADSADARTERRLLRAMGIAGFGSANIMLLSVGIWAGHASGDMGEATRTLLHWVSLMIALPVVAIAIQPFAQSALAALRRGRTNMDVPITVGVVLVTGLSIFQTLRQGEHAYFESGVMLLFFLLIGRLLDHRARGRARAVAQGLLRGLGQTASRIAEDGRVIQTATEDLTPGDQVLIATGERIGLDGVVLTGRSSVDASLLNGESLPLPVGQGSKVHAGMLNLSAPLTVQVTAIGQGTVLAEMVRLMETAEQRKSRMVLLADRIARLYTPVVHLMALLAFLLWTLILDAGWEHSLLVAASVLIITCPCALALAVPVVQVVATGRLMKDGILVKSASALERLAETDTVAFDKTGTLTEPDLALAEGAGDAAALALAAGMGRASLHPLAQALAIACPKAPLVAGVVEHQGLGLSLQTEAGEIRLGSRRFLDLPEPAGDSDQTRPELWLARPGLPPHRFVFAARLRADAAEVTAMLRRCGYDLLLISGDRQPAVAAVAAELGFSDWHAGVTPQAKLQMLESLQARGRFPLMVGDGLNDAPALAAAHASLSPSSAADLSQTAADLVFQGRLLKPVLVALQVAGVARSLVRQNIGLSIAYNAIMVPLAFAGLVTPLIAAIAMSASSLVVIGNALRLTPMTRNAADRPPVPRGASSRSAPLPLAMNA